MTQVQKHLLADLSGVSCRQDVEVGQQSAGLQHMLVPALLVLSTEQDVVLQRSVLNPGLLRDVSHRSLQDHQKSSCKDSTMHRAIIRMIQKNLFIYHYLDGNTTTSPLRLSEHSR